MDSPSFSALPNPQRFVTSHNENGLAIYSTSLPETVELGGSEGLAVSFANDKDLPDFKKLDANHQKFSLVRKNGIILQYVDIALKSVSPMHRTSSLDFGVVLIGELACDLDSGERRILKPGDVEIQRGTMHQWLNMTDSWARMVFVLIDASEVEVGNRKLGKDLGGMVGVPAS
ncbi:cupin-type protein [Colletotrichum incanum]|nr:cupin-type protein [Colletotrichum incanum]